MRRHDRHPQVGRDAAMTIGMEPDDLDSLTLNRSTHIRTVMNTGSVSGGRASV
jgi:hypothetical protein